MGRRRVLSLDNFCKRILPLGAGENRCFIEGLFDSEAALQQSFLEWPERLRRFRCISTEDAAIIPDSAYVQMRNGNYMVLQPF